jgi:hypothetical protein
MQLPRILLAAVSAAVLLPSATAQVATQQPFNLPRSMRMCGGNGLCQTLTWNDGHYDGILDGQTEVTTTFGVVRWDREAVDFTGIVSRPDPSGNYITGIFTGTISPAGNSVDAGTDTWRVGGVTGSLPFRLTWNPSDLSNAFPVRSQDRLPAFFRLCGGLCIGLTRNGGGYDAYEEGTGNHSRTATYTVASLSPELAYMNVEVANGFRGIVTGRVVGHTLVDGKLTWLNCFNGDTVSVRAAWDEEVASIEPGPIIRIPTQQTFQVSGQQQINPWLLLFGAVVGGALMDGDGPSVHRDMCGNDTSQPRGICVPASSPVILNQNSHK